MNKESTTNKLNPWKIPLLTPKTYKNLKNFYSLKDINIQLKDNPNFLKRNLIIGHDNFLDWVKKAEEGKKVALVSGFMSSGFLHLGSLTVLKQMAYYQKEYGATVIIPIVDLEALCVRKIKETEIKEIVTDFIAHFFAAGLSPKRTIIYLQTRNLGVMKEAGLFTGRIGMEELEKIYDRKLTLGEAYSSLVMAADILLPQINHYDGTLIILGIDEINHFVMTKKLIHLLGNRFSYPSITYNKILTGLNASKMGKSLPQNSIKLSDSLEVAKEKLRRIKGQNLELYSNTGFNILEWFSDNDSLIDKILKMKNKKKANDLAIDEACNFLDKFLTEHQKKYKQYLNIAKKKADILLTGNGKKDQI